MSVMKKLPGLKKPAKRVIIGGILDGTECE